MKLVDIYARMKKDISAVEKELERSVYSEHSTLRQTSVHLLKAGGKRIRPMFVLLAGQFGKDETEQVRQVAVTLELIHMATLVHDDVIDGADTRRGELTVKSKWDNRIAMYTGDYIFAKSLGIITQLPNPDIHRIFSKAIIDMCIGEMEQIRFFFHADQTIRDYLLRIKRKTALLIAVACQLGALASGADLKTANRLYSFGFNVGMAFQIRDDILDLCGTQAQIGKPPGSDIRQGNVTLPVIFALQDESLSGPIRRELDRIQLEGEGANVEQVLDMIRNSDGVRRADELSAKYITKAIAALDQFPESQAKKDLINIAHFIGNRSY